jgi:hypothetical protein
VRGGHGLGHNAPAKPDKREVFRAGELPDDMVAELEASLAKYGRGSED